MKKLLALLTMLPLAALADVPPMSRERWEALQSFAGPSLAGYALAVLVGVLLMTGLVVLSRRCSLICLPMEWIAVAVVIISCCVTVEFMFRPFSLFLSKACGESYEEYLFYERHCRKCGTALSYHQGRYCPKCNPRPTATFE